MSPTNTRVSLRGLQAGDYFSAAPHSTQQQWKLEFVGAAETPSSGHGRTLSGVDL